MWKFGPRVPPQANPEDITKLRLVPVLIDIRGRLPAGWLKP